MKTVLCVQTYPGANETFLRHMPFYLNAGASEIIAITTDDGGCIVPSGVKEFTTGRNQYLEGRHLSKRLVDTVAAALGHDADRIVVMEYDAIFLRAIPDDLEAGIHAVLVGGRYPGFKCERFYHCPWIFDRASAQRFVELGKEFIEAGEIEHGSPDMFLGLVTECVDIPVHDLRVSQHSYSVNSLDIPHQRMEARQAIKDGALSVHGVKDQEQLNFILAR